MQSLAHTQLHNCTTELFHFKVSITIFHNASSVFTLDTPLVPVPWTLNLILFPDLIICFLISYMVSLRSQLSA